jgi:hypothetical protein
METTEGLLPCWQESATGLCPKPDENFPNPLTNFL